MFADLHIHSQYSDGLLDISSIISDARNKGIEAIALTDHDTINGVIEMKKKIWDIETIPGIEITVSKKMHILGYFIDYKSCMLKKILDRMAMKLPAASYGVSDRDSLRSSLVCCAASCGELNPLWD